MREVPKDVLKMASGLISPSGLAGHRGQLCTVTLYSFIMKLIKANLAAEAEQHLHGALLLVLQQRQPQRVAGGVATDCLSILPAPDTAPQGAT